MKKNFQIKSIFEQIAEKVFTMNNTNEIKTFVTEFVESKSINNIDKQTILNNIAKCKNVTALHRYICNSLLQYESLGVGQR